MSAAEPSAESPAESIYFAALAKEAPEERSAYLDKACGGDADLRRRVERLLEAQPKVGSFLQGALGAAALGTPQTAAAPQEISETAGAVIGPYKLLEQIGEGGMGTVWMAQQTEPVKRVVALKLIKAGMDSKQVIARFEAERQALALMDHAHIARVLDAGTTSIGRPYFVMDLVKGVPITKYCDEHHLTPRQRLELFVPVCHAIQHAHQKGIIHRDLKPSNVLVALYDGKPVPKVIDFGVAKAAGQPLTEKTLVTGFGAIVGTLEYMSPEQAEINQLDIDTRSDIYSLGVLLYELLAGSPPFSRKDLETAGMLEMLRVIREQEPSKPSTKLSSSDTLPTLSANRGTEPAKLTKLVRGELDWIVMKALEKDRNRRYETANGFAADVQRYLADEAVLACPPSAGYRLRKFARRNKAALAFTGLVLVILLTLTGGIGWNVRDRAARQAAVEKEVNLALKEAERLQEQAKWPEALSAAKRAEGLLAGGGSSELRERVQQLRKDTEMVLRLEQIRLLRSVWKDHRFDNESADRAYARAFDTYGIDVIGLPVDEAAARIRARRAVADALVVALDEWTNARRRKDESGAKALQAVAEAAESDPLRRQVREAANQKDGKSLAALAAWPEILRQPPTSLLLLAGTLHNHGLVDAGIDLLRQAQRQYPGDFWINYDLATVLKSSYRDEAISFYRAAVAARPSSSAALSDLAKALSAQGKLDDAIAITHKAIEIDPNHAIAHANIGYYLWRQGKPAEAIVWCQKAIEFNPKHANAYNLLGLALSDQGKVDEGIAAYRRAIEIDSYDANYHTNLGHALLTQGQPGEAMSAYKQAVEIDSKHRRAIDLDNQHATRHRMLAWLLATCPDPRLRDPRRAVEHAKKALELARQDVWVWQIFGWVQYRVGDWRQSIKALEQSCKLQTGGTGDCGQWIVLALAHAKLAAQEGLTDKEREYHKLEARRRYEEACKQIDGWGGRPGHYFGQVIWDFRAEARALFGDKKDLK